MCGIFLHTNPIRKEPSLVEQREQYRYIYRGQEKPWRLCTPFHRTGRGDTRRFMAQDIPALHHRLSAFTRRVYNLVGPTQNAAFFHLVQHTDIRPLCSTGPIPFLSPPTLHITGLKARIGLTHLRTGGRFASSCLTKRSGARTLSKSEMHLPDGSTSRSSHRDRQ